MSKKLFFQIAALMLWGAVLFYAVSDKYFFRGVEKLNKVTGQMSYIEDPEKLVNKKLIVDGLFKTE